MSMNGSRKAEVPETNPYRNYYHWWNAERGKPTYRYSLFDVNHDAWKYDLSNECLLPALFLPQTT